MVCTAGLRDSFRSCRRWSWCGQVVFAGGVRGFEEVLDVVFSDPVCVGGWSSLALLWLALLWCVEAVDDD